MIIKQTDAAAEIYVIQFFYIYIYTHTYNFNSYKIKPAHIATYKTRLTN